MELEEKITFIQDALQKMALHTHPYLTSVVGIEGEQSGQHVGSGLRALISGKRCVVTAAHVVEQARSGYPRVAVTAVRGAAPYELQGAPDYVDREHDLAAYILPPDYPDEGIAFWPSERVDTADDQLATDFLFIHGFPAVRSRFSALAGGLLNRSFPYGVMLRTDDLPKDFAPFQLAVDFDPENLRGPDGQAIDWLDPHGLSGSPVWRIGASGRRVDEWTPDSSLLVGIVTQWRPDEKILVATKWRHVLEMFARSSPPDPRLEATASSLLVSAPSLAKPMPTAPTAPQPVDLGIIVALQEEFRELLDLAGPRTSHKDGVLTAYCFERGSYRIVAAFVGDMGEVQAMRVTERLIASWKPAALVVAGIAAGVHDDLRVGDVYVPPQAVQYMQDAKASAKKATQPAAKKTATSTAPAPDEFTLVPGAPAYRADHALLEAVRHLEFKHPDVYRGFLADCGADLVKLVASEKTRERLFKKDLVRRELTLLADGHVATGPVVGAAPGFSAWIRSHDRNVKALEMESAAVLLAAQTRDTPTRAFILRGISDYGDDRKKALDAIGKGSLRRYAMRNAVRLLWALLDTKALPLDPR